MATDPNLDRTLVMLDEQDAPEVHDDVAEARAWRLGSAFRSILSTVHIDPELFRAIPVDVCCATSSCRCLRGRGAADRDGRPVERGPAHEVELALARRSTWWSAAVADRGHPREVGVHPAVRTRRPRASSSSSSRRRRTAKRSCRSNRITADSSPIIRLVDSVLFNAIQRRASTSTSRPRIASGGEVPDRRRALPGHEVDRQAAPLDHHSRIKVMSGADIARSGSLRTALQGRFSGRTIDFRCRSCPTCTARTRSSESSTRVDERRVPNPDLSVLGLEEDTKANLRKFIREPTEWCW